MEAMTLPWHLATTQVKSSRAFDLSAYLRDWLGRAPKPRGNVRLEADVDPMSFL